MSAESEVMDLSCPLPADHYTRIVTGHGGGGRLMRDLIDQIIRPELRNPILDQQHDSAAIELSSKKLAFTTDSYVIWPLFFPGGDIGSLAVYGTVNDLSMAGASAKYLSLSFILQEGLEMQTLQRILHSIRRAAEQADVCIVTGDTKVIEGGANPGLYINTSGIGEITIDPPLSPFAISTGDAVLLNGDIGRHGTCIMALRENLQFSPEIESDCAPLHRQTEALLRSGCRIHCMRDLTRGGLTSAMVELAQCAQVGIDLQEEAIEVIPPVQSACDLFGLDPLSVANEGRFVAFVHPQDTARALSILEQESPGPVRKIGTVGEKKSHGQVRLLNSYGGQRILDLLSGEQLPRIC
ncbi:MAG TPA: hydrogenase expression/formation protein HypE [bacterium]|nr:hydrogenase expression/formation protein HypE [bacterium]HPG47265.1 hydrogenase expression/formation protein HypE [bacterium]HPM99529.1 hydrogenase expression/formation protein HypE [bacterium]